MIHNRTDKHASKIQLKCIIDSYDEMKEMEYFFDEEEIIRIAGEPDPDGKHRFIVELVRVHNVKPTKE